MNFANDIKKAKSTIEKTFVDKMSVKRYIDTIDPVTRRETHTEQEVYKDEPCFISYTLMNNDNPNTMNDNNIPIAWKPLVICKLEVKVKAGDEITIDCRHRGLAVFNGKASDVCPMLTHTEFNLGISKEA